MIIGGLWMALACGGQATEAAGTTEGTGEAARDARELSRFDRIEASGPVEVRARIAGPRTVTAIADENLVDRITTEVQGGALHVRLRDGDYDFEVEPRVEVPVPELGGVTTRRADVVVEGLDMARFRAETTGPGDIVLRGSAEAVELRTSASGDIDASALTAAEVAVHSSDTGDVRLHATTAVRGEATGSGDVVVTGDPARRDIVEG